jgi:hypothetical protein
MLHFCPIEPFGHVVSVPASTVHFCEQTGVGSMLNEFVHTPLVHSVDVSDTTLHVAPNGWFASAASGIGAAGFDPEHAIANHVESKISRRMHRGSVRAVIAAAQSASQQPARHASRARR